MTAAETSVADVLERGVGPVLQTTALGRAIVAAIEEENDDVFVNDAGAYFRVFVPDVCRVSREGIEEQLGRAVHLPGDLEVILSSFAGNIKMGETGAVWWLAHIEEPEVPDGKIEKGE